MVPPAVYFGIQGELFGVIAAATGAAGLALWAAVSEPAGLASQ